MFTKNIFFYIMLLFQAVASVGNAQTQNFVPITTQQMNSIVSSLGRTTSNYPTPQIPNNAVDITKYLPKSYTTNGHVDYTNYLQQGINENRVIIMPNFTVAVSSKGLSIPSNTTIFFPENAKIKLLPSKSTSYNILNISSAQNIKIYNPQIIGDRYAIIKNGLKGESGMGIGIRSSINIVILNAKVSDCWGDGIYLGKDKSFIKNQNISIKNAQINAARRNGISITNGDSILIDNTILYNTNGTSPQASIDIEPNSNRDEINNILLQDITSINSIYGLLIAPKMLIGDELKTMNVDIINFIDQQSVVGFRVAGMGKYLPNNTQKLLGRINIVNPNFIKNKQVFTAEKNNSLYPNIEVSNLKLSRQLGLNVVKDPVYNSKINAAYNKMGIQFTDK